MPLVQIHLLEGKSQKYIDAVCVGIHKALVSSLTSEQNPVIGRFQTVNEYKKGFIHVDKEIFGIKRSDNAIFIFITTVLCSTEMKKKLFKEIVRELKKSPKVPQEDLFIAITEIGKENWFVGKDLI